MAIQRILGTDSGKKAFEKTDSNFQEVSQQIENLDANKADKTQPTWITATLQNGWTGTLRYRKNQIGQLEIDANLTPGTTAKDTIIAILPTGYRPSNHVVPGLYNSYNGIIVPSCIVVSTAGEVNIRETIPSGTNSVRFAIVAPMV